MRRHIKTMVFSMLAARIGRFLRLRGHHSAAAMVEREMHRRSGYGHHGQHGPYQGHPGHHHGYHGHYRRRRRPRW